MTFPAPAAVDLRGLRLPLFVAVAAATGVALAPVGVDGPTLCPFAFITGHACPGCGLTRAIVALFHGHFATALAYHPLAPLVAVEILAGGILWAARRSGRRRSPGSTAVAWVLAVTGVALVAVWVVRLASGTLPPV